MEDVLRAPLPTRVGDGRSSGCARSRRRCPSATAYGAFTRLYRAVTEAVDEHARPGSFADVRFTRWLDVVFANLYFRALRAYFLGPKRPPRAWAPLFEARSRRGVAPIQFALAGMNAHINRDLPLALVETCQARRVSRGPRLPSARRLPAHRRSARGDAKSKCGTSSQPGSSAGRTRRSVSSTASSRCGTSARLAPAAWVNAETLWALRDLPFAAGRFVLTLDRMVGFAGRGLLRARRLKAKPRESCAFGPRPQRTRPGTVPGHVPSARVRAQQFCADLSTAGVASRPARSSVGDAPASRVPSSPPSASCTSRRAGSRGRRSSSTATTGGSS